MLLDILKRNKKSLKRPVDQPEKNAKQVSVQNQQTCKGCGAHWEIALWEEVLNVCPTCGLHHRIKARKRIGSILDPNSFVEEGQAIVSGDPLGFPGYPQKLSQGKLNSGENESVITGRGAIDGQPVCIFVMEPDFMMGSLGSAAGEKITHIIERAIALQIPVIGFCASGGARMQEGILALMQMARTSAALGALGEEGIPYFVVLTDPTTGGVTASYAMLGDVILAEPGALIGFAGQRVIEQTIRQSLPAGFQRSEFLEERGFVDRIVSRSDQRSILSQLINMHMSGKGGANGASTGI